MDLMATHSPSSSVSPPISPIKLFHHHPAGTTALPPLKNLPVWNRPGLEKSRFIRSITKDSPEVGKTEILIGQLTSKSTQTSPPSTAFTNMIGQNGLGVSDKMNPVGSVPIVQDKRLYFLQSEHDNVLKNLHSELDKLKSHNRDLTFKFVMTKKGISVSPDSKDQRGSAKSHGSAKKLVHRNSSGIKRNSGRRVEELRDAKGDTRKNRGSFKSAGTRNSEIVEDQHQSSKAVATSAKYRQADQSKHQSRNQSCKSSSYSSAKHQEIESIQSEVRDAQHLSYRTNSETLRGSSSATWITGQKYASEDYEGIIRDLKKLNAKQASELSHLKDKLTEQKGRSEDFYLQSPPLLPKLNLRNPSKSAKMPQVIRGRHEIMTLPVLRPILGNKLSNRQRKAQASHVQRQRSNKDIAQKLM